jgi:hypothetical protein
LGYSSRWSTGTQSFNTRWVREHGVYDYAIYSFNWNLYVITTDTEIDNSRGHVVSCIC